VALISLVCAAILALYLNPLGFWLCVAAVPVIICYPLAKRFFQVPQLVLSIAWGFAILISWSAAVDQLELTTGLLWGALVLWTMGFDTVYAMSDREDDLRLGVNSSAIFFGDNAANAVGLFFVGTVGLLAAMGINLHLHMGFGMAIRGSNRFNPESLCLSALYPVARTPPHPRSRMCDRFFSLFQDDYT
jgi:4-hydroxybenzoate polyprenyltransferase